MDILTLKQWIENALANPPFHISGGELGSPGITKLLTEFLSSDSLPLDGATKAGETDSDIAVKGQLGHKLLGLLGLQAVATFVVANGVAEVSIQLTDLPVGWKPSDSFPSLKCGLFDAFNYERPTLRLDSQGKPELPQNFPTAYDYQPYSNKLRSSLVSGLSLQTQLTISSRADPIAWLIGDAAQSADGPIALASGFPSIALQTERAAQFKVLAYDISFRLTVVAALIEPTTSTDPIVVGCLQFEADIAKDLGGSRKLDIPVFVREYSSQPNVLLIQSKLEGPLDLLLEDISKLIGDHSIEGTVPSSFPVLKDIQLESIDLSLNAATRKPLSVSATVAYKRDNGWPVFDGLIKFQGLHVTFALVDLEGLKAVEVDVTASAVVSGGMLDATLSLPSLDFSCALVADSIDIATLIQKIAGGTVTMPHITCTDFAVFGNITDAYFQLRATVTSNWVFHIGSKPLTIEQISLDLTHITGAQGSTSGQMVGVIGLAGQQVFVGADYDSGAGTSWNFEGGTLPGQSFSLSDLVADLAALFRIEIPANLPQILLQDVYMQFNTATRQFLIGCTIDLPNTSISLSNLPLIGDKIPPDMSLALRDIQVAAGTGLGLSVSPELQLGPHDSITFNLNFGGDTTKRQDGALTLLLTAPAPRLSTSRAAAPTPSSDGAIWLVVQKSFGPLNVEKIGVAPTGAGLEVLINASIALSSLSVELEGLGVTIPLTAPYTPSFDLRGLAIDYQSGAVSISGGFLKVVNRDESVEYDGEAQIQAESFTLSAIGSYTTVDKHPSLFIFALLDVPLGGPAFFFVTGLAAGFGFNRSLLIPTLDALPQFPLVQGAMAGANGNNPFAGTENNPGAALEVMHQYIPPAPGEDWLAAGVRFTSFEMIQSFALLTDSFGTRSEVALLGLSTLTVPTNVEAGQDPIGFAEMALEVTFSPISGLLAVDAKLTPESYILAQACHLTGGFALYIWFKDNHNGAAAGDFVVTLGGYHPDFSKPGYYPVEPLVGFNWQVNANLMVKGGMYFALTPSAVMAGGNLEATWQSGDLSAWFDANANFLLSWKPFHYEIGMNLSLGASYKINLLFTSFTITVHVGVGLQLWGPSFAGAAHIDLYVVSFTIFFGDSSPSVEPIPWSDFRNSFLPKPDSGSTAMQPRLAHLGLATVTSTPVPTDSYCISRVSNGLIKNLTRNKITPEDIDWVIDPTDFELVTHSLIPCNKATLITGNGSKSNPGVKTTEITGPWTNDGFGVGPVGVAGDDFASHQVISVMKLEGGNPDNSYDFSAVIALSPTIERIPAAAWSKEIALDPSIAKINASPSTIANVLTGFTLSPRPTTPDHTPLPIDIVTLEDQRDPKQPGFVWATPNVATTDPFDQKAAIQKLMSSIQSNPASTSRAAILDALVAQRIVVETSTDVRRMAASIDAVLLHAPVLSYLGEERGA